jgi:hypothetical protein
MEIVTSFVDIVPRTSFCAACHKPFSVTLLTLLRNMIVCLTTPSISTLDYKLNLKL